MSNELRRQGKQGRPLTDQEKALILALLGSRSNSLSSRLDGALVEDMADGGMGSIRFVHESASRPAVLGTTVAEAEYIDSDEVPVQIAVNLDKDGELFEVDFWKVDFSALCSYPSPGQLIIKQLQV